MLTRDLIDVLKALYPSICIDAIINLSKFDNLEDVLIWVKDNRPGWLYLVMEASNAPEHQEHIEKVKRMATRISVGANGDPVFSPLDWEEFNQEGIEYNNFILGQGVDYYLERIQWWQVLQSMKL